MEDCYKNLDMVIKFKIIDIKIAISNQEIEIANNKGKLEAYNIILAKIKI